MTNEESNSYPRALPSLGRARRVLNRRARSGALNPRRPDDLGGAARVGASDGMPELLRRVLK